MKNPIKTYGFWVKIISAAMLLTLGLWIIFDRNLGETLVMGVTGAVILIYALIRFYPLIKTIKSKQAKIVAIVEIALDIIAGAIVFAGGIVNQQNPDSGFAEFMISAYKYFLGGVLYISAVAYFMSIVLYKEETDQTKFWVHMAAMTLGAVIMALDGFTATKLAIVLAILALICGIALVVDGFFGYGRYRKEIGKNEAPKKSKKDAGTELPARDGSIIDKKDEPTDRPFIN